MLQTLKRTYHLLAGLALANLLIVLAVVAYFAMQGTLTPQRLRAAVETLAAASEDESTDEDATETPTAGAPPASAPIADAEEREIARLNLERVTRSAEDRLRYASRLMVDIARQREQLAASKAEVAELRATETGRETDAAIQKDLEILSMLKPKVALDNVLARPMSEAAEVMRALDARTGKKIIEAASKDPRKWPLMLQIQERMRTPVQAVATEPVEDTEAAG
jgi:Skp family chaperone for outer membrane proteins